MIVRVISGGQTGVDRAALDAAIAAGLDYGGWCARGGRAEDLPDPPGLLARYPQLEETPSEDGAQRTEWNVRDSDATLVLTRADAESPGTALTVESARRLGRPCAVVDPADPEAAQVAIEALMQMIHLPAVLNVAGARESEAPGIYAEARALVGRLLATQAGPMSGGT